MLNPPVGNLRWKASNIQSDKILPKDENFCIQRKSNLGGTAEGDDFYAGSEDSLYFRYLYS